MPTCEHVLVVMNGVLEIEKCLPDARMGHTEAATANGLTNRNTLNREKA